MRPRRPTASAGATRRRSGVARDRTRRVRRVPAAVPAARVVADTPPHRPARAVARHRLARAARRRSGASSLPGTLRAPLVIGVAVLALALVVGGVGAYVFLPTATAVITPRQTTIGPVPLRIVADPAAVEPDPETRTVPAQTKTVDVEATQTFTGDRQAGRGDQGQGHRPVPEQGLHLDQHDPAREHRQHAVRHPVPDGPSGHRPARRARRPPGVPGSAKVQVTAVNAGTEGNVEPNTILVIPRGEDPLTLDVTNPDQTTGGTREEFPRIVQADLDAATRRSARR